MFKAEEFADLQNHINYLNHKNGSLKAVFVFQHGRRKATNELMQEILGEDAVSGNMGIFNGYLIFDNAHPVFGADIDMVNSLCGECADRVGGITYAEAGTSFKTVCKVEEKELLESGLNDYLNHDHWIIGFDTARIGMTTKEWHLNRVIQEVELLAENMKNT